MIAGAAAGLLTGLYAGLALLGIRLPMPFELTPMAHGPLMINGFLGTLISLERAAALEKSWSYAAPVAFFIANLLLLAGISWWSGIFVLVGSSMLIIILGYLLITYPSTYHGIMLLGGCALFIGNSGFAAGIPVHEIIGWWVAFPVLTIFGERLELNRIMRPPPKVQYVFLALILLWILLLALVHLYRDAAWMASGLLLIVMAVWLWKYDIARRTIRTSDWTRYSALNMLTAYVWIVLAGALSMMYGLPHAGPVYDAIVHLFFVGFVFSMIFAHAAVIIPALTGLRVGYHGYFFIPYVILNLFLAMRVAGDLVWLPELRTAGAYGNVAAILLFLAGIAVQLVRRPRTLQ